MKQKLQQFFLRYPHWKWLLYWIFYLTGFVALEQIQRGSTLIIEVPLDRIIPFSEIWAIPYMSWFFYMAGFMAYFFFRSPEDFKHQCAFLFTGMTICLIIYALWPNGLHLRPETVPRQNPLSSLMLWLWSIDTPTNVCPSIHWLASIGVHISVWRASCFRHRPAIRYGSLILCVLICLSTLFVKQHSIVDGIAAMALSVPLYLLSYRNPRWVLAPAERTKIEA